MTQDEFEFLLRTDRSKALNSSYYKELERSNGSLAIRYKLLPPPGAQQMIADIMRQSGIPNMAMLNPKPSNGGRFASPMGTNGCKVAGSPAVKEKITYDLFFHVKHAKTGNSMTNTQYKITLTDGSTFEGVTDENGYTKKAFSNTAQLAKIEVPYHDNTINSNKQSEPCDC